MEHHTLDTHFNNFVTAISMKDSPFCSEGSDYQISNTEISISNLKRLYECRAGTTIGDRRLHTEISQPLCKEICEIEVIFVSEHLYLDLSIIL